MSAIKLFPLLVATLVLLFTLTCKDKNVSNENPEKETAKIFFGDGTYMDVEEIVGAAENRITCKQTTPAPGIVVNVRDSDGREFRLEIDNVTTTGFQFHNAYAWYKDVNGEEYETPSLSDLQNVEIYWRDNLEVCEFAFGSGQTITQLFSQNAQIVVLDSLNIRAFREDD
jgi:hypothetical protein